MNSDSKWYGRKSTTTLQTSRILEADLKSMPLRHFTFESSAEFSAPIKCGLIPCIYGRKIPLLVAGALAIRFVKALHSGRRHQRRRYYGEEDGGPRRGGRRGRPRTARDTPRQTTNRHLKEGTTIYSPRRRKTIVSTVYYTPNPLIPREICVRRYDLEHSGSTVVGSPS